MSRRSAVAASLLLASITILTAETALASPPAINMPAEENPSPSREVNSDEFTPFGFVSGINKSSTLLGSMWGARPFLSQYGISFGLQEVSEVLGNVSGGINRGFDYDGLTQMAVQMDTQRALGWYGGTFNVSALQIHGRNLSADNLGTIQTSSGIEAERNTRLWELWYDQKFLAEDRLDVRIGQQSIDQEFMVSTNALLFVNTMFGWPALPSYDMPDGGPAYPLSALGARMKVRPNDSVTVLGGIYNGAPAGNDGVNNSGTGFPTDGGLLAIGEIQYTYPALGAMVDPTDAEALSGTYKLGVWYDDEQFADQEIDNTGLSLANPATTGNPLQHRGNFAVYGVADQMIWHSSEDPDRTVNLFMRAMGTPKTDRNLLDFSLNFGVTVHEPFFLRDDDTFGIGMGYAHVSSRAASLDQDANANGTYQKIRGGETFIEATYSYEVTPWWQVQPDFQYIFNPGAGQLSPNGERIGNEAVIGIRTIINF